MERVYFDKQIFSFLYKGDKPAYQRLLNDLLNSKSRFLFCYSHAHLLDLKNDKTDIKYRELDFMDDIVGDNYLSYNASEKRTSCYLARPSEAFKNLDLEEEAFSFTTLFDDIDLSFASEEEAEKIQESVSLIKNQRFDFGIFENLQMPADFSDTLGRFLPENLSTISALEWAEHFMGIVKTLEEDKTAYKGLRNVIDKNLNDGKFTIEYDTIDFNDDLKNSALQKTFLEFVNSNLDPDGNKVVTDYDFYTQAYFALDLLGISKEKNARFRNVLNDAFHSYYGAFCDFVVSEDQGFLKKTKALYRLLGIESRIFHIDEFIDYLTLNKEHAETDFSTFIKLLEHQIKTGLVVRTKSSLQFNRQTTEIKSYHPFLGHFNRIELMNEDEENYILLRRRTKNYSHFNFYREYQGIVNNAYHIFGHDKNSKGTFDWNTETKEIENSKWQGRQWNIGQVTVLLEINESIDEICLLITRIGNIKR